MKLKEVVSVLSGMPLSNGSRNYCFFAAKARTSRSYDPKKKTPTENEAITTTLLSSWASQPNMTELGWVPNPSFTAVLGQDPSYYYTRASYTARRNLQTPGATKVANTLSRGGKQRHPYSLACFLLQFSQTPNPDSASRVGPVF